MDDKKKGLSVKSAWTSYAQVGKWWIESDLCAHRTFLIAKNKNRKIFTDKILISVA